MGGLLEHAVHDQPLEVRRGGLERLADPELERRRGRRAAAAVALEPDPRDAVLERDELDRAAVGLHVGPHALERLAHPVLQRDRVQPVHEQDARDRAVVEQPRLQRVGALVGDGVHDPLERLAVELHQRAGELLAGLVELGGELSDTRQQRLGVHASSQQSPVGVCITLRTLPLPVYMCTPHGRQGSNEWTARMMSTPLKSSGPFSSKIGVFWTASS